MKDLFPHNQRAYDNAVEMFKEHQRVSIIHPTGSGKTFVSARLAQDYDRVLVCTPGKYIFDEFAELGVKAQFVTYTWLICQTIFDRDAYDLIILDEFHRAGAQQWGEGVRRLLDANPDAKVFGTTATNVRYLDGGRDMSKELFNGCVASYISLPDAWVGKILKAPKYIIGMYTFDVIRGDLEYKLGNSKLTEHERTEYLRRFESNLMDWTKAYGVSEVFKKHMYRDVKRIIVFCDHIEHMTEMQHMVAGWLSDAGLNIGQVYSVHYNNEDSDDEMKAFKEYDREGVAVMFAVNMLNEGVHVPEVDAVVLLRSTTSRILHLQQIGRGMNADNERQLLVFDLVDNLTRSNTINEVMREFNEKKASAWKNSQDTNELYDFKVVDYVKDIRDVMNELTSKLLPNNKDAQLELIERYINTYHKWPSSDNYVISRIHYILKYGTDAEKKRLEDIVAPYEERFLGCMFYLNRKDDLNITERAKSKNRVLNFINSKARTTFECNRHTIYNIVKDDPYYMSDRKERSLAKINAWIEFCYNNGRCPTLAECKVIGFGYGDRFKFVMTNELMRKVEETREKFVEASKSHARHLRAVKGTRRKVSVRSHNRIVKVCNALNELGRMASYITEILLYNEICVIKKHLDEFSDEDIALFVATYNKYAAKKIDNPLDK